MIGFLAKRKAGKDTSCDYICTKYGYTKRGFADPLKKGIQQWFHFSEDQLYTEEKDKDDVDWGVSPRYVCQVIGTDIVRDLFSNILLPNIGDNFWIKSADIWYERQKEQHKGNVVWCDVRFQNEVDYILSKGGSVYKIDRSCLVEQEYCKVDDHMSELSVDNIKNYTSIIKNDGSLEDLYSKLDNIFSDKML
jgi:hypothetical protein